MKIIELKCTAYLKKGIDFKASFEIISKHLSHSMCQNKRYEKEHNENKFNNYCFGGFLPIEKSKIYKRGNTYEFSIRGVDEKFMNEFQNYIKQNTNNENFIVVEIQKIVLHQKFITELYSATPVIVTSSKDMMGSSKKEQPLYWTINKDGDIVKLQKQLHENLLKKQKYFFNEDFKTDINFIQLIEIKNAVPQTIYLKDKNHTLFGNKFRIIPNEDEVSQKLAFLALGVGLGEKMSFGAGFCLGKGMRL